MLYALCTMLFALHFVVSKTMNNVVIVHPDRLHKCVNDRGANKTKSTFLEVFADGIADRGSGLKITYGS